MIFLNNLLLDFLASFIGCLSAFGISGLIIYKVVVKKKLQSQNPFEGSGFPDPDGIMEELEEEMQNE